MLVEELGGWVADMWSVREVGWRAGREVWRTGETLGKVLLSYSHQEKLKIRFVLFFSLTYISLTLNAAQVRTAQYSVQCSRFTAFHLTKHLSSNITKSYAF